MSESAVWHVVLLALTVIMEARGQPRLGQEMVMHVVMNRVERSGWTVEQVVFQEGQFAVWGDLDVRLRVLQCAHVLPEEPLCPGVPWGIGSEELWWEMYELAKVVYSGERAEPAGLEGMLYFDDPGNWPEGLPAWMGDDCVTIAEHTFCRGG